VVKSIQSGGQIDVIRHAGHRQGPPHRRPAVLGDDRQVHRSYAAVPPGKDLRPSRLGVGKCRMRPYSGTTRVARLRSGRSVFQLDTRNSGGVKLALSHRRRVVNVVDTSGNFSPLQPCNCGTTNRLRFERPLARQGARARWAEA